MPLGHRLVGVGRLHDQPRSPARRLPSAGHRGPDELHESAARAGLPRPGPLPRQTSTKVHHACDGRGRPLAVLVCRARPTTGRSCRSCSARSPCPNSGRDGPAPARMRSWPTRPTPRGRPGGCCALAASPRSSPNLATSRPTANAEAGGVADRSATTPKAYKGRNVVERSLNALKQWPGLATRYEARRHLPRRRRPGRDPHLATRIRRRALDPLADHHGLAHAVARTGAALARTPSRRAR